MTANGGELSGGNGPGLTSLGKEDYQRLHPKLTAHFRRQGCSGEEARDLVQETLLRTWQSREKFQGRSELDTWVVSIAKTVWLQDARDRGRQKRRAEEVPIETLHAGASPSGGAPGPEAVAVGKDLLARTTQAMRELPEAMRQALKLYLDGHKYRHIAILLGVSENQVSSLIHQARAKLRRKVPT